MPYVGITEDEFRNIIPIGEIQRYEGNCWAAALSMVLRCHDFDFNQNYVTSLLREWRIEGVTSKQMSDLVEYFNRNFLSKKNWIMKTTDSWQRILQYIGQFAPIQVFITGHFVVMIGYDDSNDQITYFDPWDGSVLEVSKSKFARLGGGETVYMYKE